MSTSSSIAAAIMTLMHLCREMTFTRQEQISQGIRDKPLRSSSRAVTEMSRASGRSARNNRSQAHDASVYTESNMTASGLGLEDTEESTASGLGFSPRSKPSGRSTADSPPRREAALSPRIKNSRRMQNSGAASKSSFSKMQFI